MTGEHRNQVARGYIFELPRKPDTKMKREMWDGVLDSIKEGSLSNFLCRTFRLQDSKGFIMNVLTEFSFSIGTCGSITNRHQRLVFLSHDLTFKY